MRSGPGISAKTLDPLTLVGSALLVFACLSCFGLASDYGAPGASGSASVDGAVAERNPDVKREGGADAGPSPSKDTDSITDVERPSDAVPTADAGADAGRSSDADRSADAGVDAGTPSDAGLARFSFFVTSYKAIQALSGSQNGFGGDLTYGETGPGAGLRGADKICAAIAERSMPGSSAKQWRAFLSVTADENGKQVDAIDRIGNGPWYDRLGRLFANSKSELLYDRPSNADPIIKDDFPNEDGNLNHDPNNSGDLYNNDNHDMLTGSDAQGRLMSSTATCKDWTTSDGAAANGRPRVGHSWPRKDSFGGGGFGGSTSGALGSMNNWMSALDESGCAAVVNLLDNGPPPFGVNGGGVGAGGGYGGFYCFALVP
jgi:hypothetical protein